MKSNIPSEVCSKYWVQLFKIRCRSEVCFPARGGETKYQPSANVLINNPQLPGETLLFKTM